jgi:hypothetical protein
MPDNKDQDIIKDGGGVFNELSMRVKLILRLMVDPRVNFLLKLLPIGSLIYFIIPDLILGPIDDAAIIWLGTFLFVELCPPEVVQEHMDELRQVLPGEWHDPDEKEDDIIDAEFWEKDPE